MPQYLAVPAMQQPECLDDGVREGEEAVTAQHQDQHLHHKPSFIHHILQSSDPHLAGLHVRQQHRDLPQQSAVPLPQFSSLGLSNLGSVKYQQKLGILNNFCLI